MMQKKFKTGDALKIRNGSRGADWYTDDIYYVIEYVPYNIHYELVSVRTISGLDLVAHDSKFELVTDLGRDERIDYLIGDDYV